MKKSLLALAPLLLAALSHADPLEVGTVSANVGFSEGGSLSGSTYSSLQQRRLSDYPDKVLVLVYYTPW